MAPHVIYDILYICNPYVADSSPLPNDVSEFQDGTLAFTSVQVSSKCISFDMPLKDQNNQNWKLN